MNRIELLIHHYMNKNEINVLDIARATRISSATIYRCLASPADWRLGNLNKVYTYLRVPLEEREFRNS